MAAEKHEEVAVGPTREQCSPLPGRGILSLEFGIEDGYPAVTLVCDCGTATRTVIELPGQAVEIPLSCVGCATVTWLTAYPMSGGDPE